MTVLPHYAEFFSPRPGQCFRLVCRPDAEGKPIHSQAPVIAVGDCLALNNVYRAEDCAGHAGDLLEARRKKSG